MGLGSRQVVAGAGGGKVEVVQAGEADKLVLAVQPDKVVLFDTEENSVEQTW